MPYLTDLEFVYQYTALITLHKPRKHHEAKQQRRYAS